MSRLITAGIVALVLVSFPASAQQVRPVMIVNDDGGGLATYYQRYTDLRRAGASLEIDGWCFSSCTLVLATFPRDRVCVTDFTMFGFHSAFAGGNHTPEGTRFLWAHYPDWVQRLLRVRGWDGGSTDNEHPELIMLPGSLFYPLCTE